MVFKNGPDSFILKNLFQSSSLKYVIISVAIFVQSTEEIKYVQSFLGQEYIKFKSQDGTGSFLSFSVLYKYAKFIYYLNTEVIFCITTNYN